jgi:hypothetical protein
VVVEHRLRRAVPRPAQLPRPGLARHALVVVCRRAPAASAGREAKEGGEAKEGREAKEGGAKDGEGGLCGRTVAGRAAGALVGGGG